MIVVDENIVEPQRALLRRWRIKFRQVEFDLGRAGMGDDEIVPLLCRIGNVTFFTRDAHFFDPRLRHSKCCFVWLDVDRRETAFYIRRFLRHPQFKIRNSRLGAIARVAHAGVFVWPVKATKMNFIPWPPRRRK
jgi:hypothetical protein